MKKKIGFPFDGLSNCVQVYWNFYMTHFSTKSVIEVNFLNQRQFDCSSNFKKSVEGN